MHLSTHVVAVSTLASMATAIAVQHDLGQSTSANVPSVTLTTPSVITPPAIQPRNEGDMIFGYALGGDEDDVQFGCVFAAEEGHADADISSSLSSTDAKRAKRQVCARVPTSTMVSVPFKCHTIDVVSAAITSVSGVAKVIAPTPGQASVVPKYVCIADVPVQPTQAPNLINASLGTVTSLKPLDHIKSALAQTPTYGPLSATARTYGKSFGGTRLLPANSGMKVQGTLIFTLLGTVLVAALMI